MAVGTKDPGRYVPETGSEPDLKASSLEYEEFLAYRSAKADAEASAPGPPEYWVHLADGQVITAGEDDEGFADSHVGGVQVIGRYQVGA